MNGNRLKAAVRYLESIGLEVVGLNWNLETGEGQYGMRGYSPEDVIKYRRLLLADKLIEPGEPR